MDVNKKYFNNISNRERALFEGAITMGALFHQFIGIPINLKSVESLEQSIKTAMELQPCINKVNVEINRNILKEIENEYDYISLTGEMLDVKVESNYSNGRAIIRLKYISELNYPLMYVEDIR
ncbi:MAG: dihydroneopterin aldolase family protein [Methanobacterium sp.]|nr:dihydroneopterin aldolase family protein [Methanobacterium sp.]